MTYNVIYSDCPWQFGNVRTGGSLKSGSAQKYDVLSTEALCELPGFLPHDGLIADDAVLFHWTPVPMLPEALAVMKAWGFHYKTAIFWHKTGRFGTGFWLRGEVEMLLVGIRGRVKPFRAPIRNHIEAPGYDWIVDGQEWAEPQVLRHSQKPEEFRQIIETVTARTMSWRLNLELFARQTVLAGRGPSLSPVEPWTFTGLEFDGVDVTVPEWWKDPRFGVPLDAIAR